MLKKFVVLAVAVLVAAVFAHPASARTFGEIFKECGLGAMIFDDNRDAAAVSNIVWDSGTTATSSATTTPDSCKGGQEKIAAFIHDAYEMLEKDLASGDGEYLDTLVTLAGVTTSEAEFIKTLRRDFAAVVAEAGYTAKSRYEKAETLFNLVNKNV